MPSVFNRGRRDKPSWYAQIKDAEGKWRMKPTHQPTKALAWTWAVAEEGRMARERAGVVEAKPETTFGAWVDRWLAEYSATTLTSHRTNMSRVKHLAPLRDLPLGQITPQRIDTFKAEMLRATEVDAAGNLSAKWSPQTVNHVLNLLHKILSDACRWELIPSVPKITMCKVPERPFAYLDRDGTARFLSWSSENAPDEFPMYSTAIYIGMRMGELYGLRWDDVDLPGARITVQRSYDQPYTKSKKVWQIKLNKHVVGILRDWRARCPNGPGADGPVLVFPMPDGTMRAAEKPPAGFFRHLSAAGCRRIRFHDLRHTAASLMVMAGMNMRTVQKILGHASVKVTERYAHLAPDYMQAEADKLFIDIAPRGRVIALQVLDGGAEGAGQP